MSLIGHILKRAQRRADGCRTKYDKTGATSAQLREIRLILAPPLVFKLIEQRRVALYTKANVPPFMPKSAPLSQGKLRVLPLHFLRSGKTGEPIAPRPIGANRRSHAEIGPADVSGWTLRRHRTCPCTVAR